MKWLSRRDDDWPDWAHACATMALATALAAPWLWAGLPALFNGTLPPVMGPDFGTWLFGPHTLNGRAARLAGGCLVLLGITWLVGGLACTRWAEGRRSVRWLFWAMLALDLLLYRWALATA